jgi:MCP family monocarboxylic acid transporter-like MFS transporter 14
VAGSGIGTFIFAPLTEYLIEQYSWRGALLLIGGLMLNLVICGAIFRPLVIPKPSLDMSPVLADFQSPSHLGKSCDDLDLVSNHVALTSRFTLQAQLCDGDCTFIDPSFHSLIQFPTYLDAPMSASGDVGAGELSKVTPDILFDLHQKCQLLRTIHTDCELGRAYTNSPEICLTSQNTLGLARDNHLTSETELPRRLMQIYNSNVFYRGGLLRARLLFAGDRSSSCPDIFVHSREEEEVMQGLGAKVQQVIRMLWRTVLTMFDPSFFRSAIFVLFCTHSLLLYISYNTPYIYIPDVATHVGISAEAASTLISVSGVASTIGQVRTFF